MIARLWHGSAVRGKADDYVEHLRREVLPGLARIEGCRGAHVLRREAGDGVEFVVLTLWESMDAVRRFAGPDAETAVVAPAAQELLRAFDPTVTHYEVALSWLGGAG
jgi:heme-degrading monooxygenase HmoA